MKNLLRGMLRERKTENAVLNVNQHENGGFGIECNHGVVLGMKGALWLTGSSRRAIYEDTSQN